MPFKSQAQRRFMFARHPAMARRWQRETGKRRLPEYKTMDKSAVFMAGVMAKMANSPVVNALDDREDSRIIHMRQMAKMAPAERRRYLADMSARNHRLAVPKTAAVMGGGKRRLQRLAESVRKQNPMSRAVVDVRPTAPGIEGSLGRAMARAKKRAGTLGIKPPTVRLPGSM